jgi:hypothetical protein
MDFLIAAKVQLLLTRSQESFKVVAANPSQSGSLLCLGISLLDYLLSLGEIMQNPMPIELRDQNLPLLLIPFLPPFEMFDCCDMV